MFDEDRPFSQETTPFLSIATVTGLIFMLLGGLGLVGALVTGGGAYLIATAYRDWNDGYTTFTWGPYNLLPAMIEKDDWPTVFLFLMVGKIFAGLLIITIGLYEPWTLPSTA